MFMKNLVFQVNVQPDIEPSKPGKEFCYFRPMYETSERYAKNYAKKYNAEYYSVTKNNEWEPGIGKHVSYQKYRIYDLFEHYDNIVYIDMDFIIKDNAPSIFDICKNEFAGVTENPDVVKGHAKRLGIPVDRYMNTGFIYFNKEVLEKTKKPILDYYIHQEWEFHDQGLWNRVFFDYNIKYKNLKAEEWNPLGKYFGLYADHYCGKGKKRHWGDVEYL